MDFHTTASISFPSVRLKYVDYFYSSWCHILTFPCFIGGTQHSGCGFWFESFYQSLSPALCLSHLRVCTHYYFGLFSFFSLPPSNSSFCSFFFYHLCSFLKEFNPISVPSFVVPLRKCVVYHLSSFLLKLPIIMSCPNNTTFEYLYPVYKVPYSLNKSIHLLSWCTQ